jgi:hypothetical protein
MEESTSNLERNSSIPDLSPVRYFGPDIVEQLGADMVRLSVYCTFEELQMEIRKCGLLPANAKPGPLNVMHRESPFHLCPNHQSFTENHSIPA